MKKIILFMSLFAVYCAGACAQKVTPTTINASGGSKTIGSNEFEWSIGEMTLVSTFTNSGIIVTQGVLQPDDGLLDVANTTLSAKISVFPNPASSSVNIRLTTVAQGKMTYRLTDVLGQVVKTATFNVPQGTTTEEINVSSLANATYMLEVITSTGMNVPETSTFKIQKLN